MIPSPRSPSQASFDDPWPWHSLSEDQPRQRALTVDVFRALCEHSMHRLSGVAFDDDTSLAGVTRYLNEGRANDGVGQAFALVIDGVRITLIEDANDGHRSVAEEVELERLGPVRNRFIPVDVHVVWSPRVRWGETHGDRSLDASLIELRCPYTSALILEAGTCWGDEHYPSMVSAFHPEAMAETVRRAEVRELHACATAAMPDPQVLRSRPRL